MWWSCDNGQIVDRGEPRGRSPGQTGARRLGARVVGRRQQPHAADADGARSVSRDDLRIRAAAALAAMDCDIITGGGPGLMQAANEGAASRQAQSYGIRVDLPFEQNVNAFVTEAYEHRTFFT